MFNGKARILRFEPEKDKRIIVLSDIHGNLPYLKGILEKLSFRGDDLLIVNGDFMEKGPDSLGTMRYIMDLCGKERARAVCGNCDSWDGLLSFTPESDANLARYLRFRRSGMLWEMLLEMGIDPLEDFRFSRHLDAIAERYSKEFDFLASLPHAIETERFIFVHAGMDANKPLEEHSTDELNRRDRFMAEGQSFSKWLIVGHYPVVLYGESIVNANPVMDREKKIISLDGGCVIKDDGQLNALIIPPDESEDFYFESYDHFPRRKVKSSQSASERSFYIPWGNNLVRVLRRGEEFSRCRHIPTGYEMDILTRYLYSDEEVCRCNDCTDYRLPLRAGDEVGVVEESSRGYFVKHGGVSGWYCGELE